MPRRRSPDEVLTPAASLPRRAEHGSAQVGAREGFTAAVLCFGEPFLTAACKALDAVPTGRSVGPFPVFAPVAASRRRSVALLQPGLGSPAAAFATEKLFAVGARRLVGLGFCGAIGRDLARGDALLPTAVHSTEGTSAQYGPGIPDAALRAALASQAGAHGLSVRDGTVWTTDAIYRETPGRLDAARRAGAVGVDMETSGFLAAARFRGVAAACLLLASDRVDVGEGWTPAAAGSLAGETEAAVRAALDVLSSP